MSKVAIVTAASSGMGEACARELAARGYDLMVMSRSDKINELSAELNCKAFQGDLSNEADIKNLVDLTIESYGKIDAIINSSGHSAKGELLDISDQDWTSAFDLLLLSSVRLSRLVTPHFTKQRSGAIVNISSFAAKEPSLSFPTSSVIRASLSAFAKLYAQQYGPEQVRMNNILPGFIDSYEVDAETLKQIPMQRSGTVHEIAKTAAFLISDDAAYINGQNIAVDGSLLKSL